MDEEFIITNIRISKKHRNKLKNQEIITGKGMSQIIRELIDLKFPDPNPSRYVVTPNGQTLQILTKPANVKEEYTEQDFIDLLNGDVKAKSRFFKKDD